jgi:hypothetical protein
LKAIVDSFAQPSGSRKLVKHIRKSQKPSVRRPGIMYFDTSNPHWENKQCTDVPSSIRQAKGKNHSEPSRRRIKRKEKRKGLKKIQQGKGGTS